MSCNYAEGLSPYQNKGKLGIPEIFDDPSEAEAKAEKLAEWIKAAKYVVVHTGAGISTAAGIPDFRGPNGVWTLEEKGLKPNINISFDVAKPTLTHMTLAALINSGHVKYIVSQNIDGLHLRSGLKRVNMSELHGNMFVAQCNFCDRQFIQKTSVPTVGQKEIGLDCPWVKSGGRSCRGKLRDNILDWEHNLPERDLEAAEHHSTLADLSICLGTTLQIVPAGNLPLRCKKNSGKVVIVNLQPTKHHKKADLVIHTQVDRVLTKVAELLGVSIPPYTPEIDPTYILKHCPPSKGGVPRYLDWTIPVSSISKLKNLISALKGNSTKKPKVQRKRRRTEKDESSDSDDDYYQKPEKRTTSDFQSFIKVKDELEGDNDIKPASRNPKSASEFYNGCVFPSMAFPTNPPPPNDPLPLDLSVACKNEPEEKDAIESSNYSLVKSTVSSHLPSSSSTDAINGSGSISKNNTNNLDDSQVKLLSSL